MLPELVTERLALRPCADDDLDQLWTLWTDPDVRRFLWDDRAITREEAAATLADCRALEPDGLGLWMMAPRADPPRGDAPRAIGCAALLPVTTAAEFEPRLAGLVEPLIALDPGAWGQGFAVESLMALRAYATDQLGLRRLAGVTDVPNVASDRMLRRAGFTILGECDGPRHRLRTYLYETATP
jgi:RimJ/RimL family protein N-acetyltransferase